MKHSVEAYNIYDNKSHVLQDNDLVLYNWGGGNDGKVYDLWRIHRLSISRRGKLKISGYENLIRGSDLVFISDTNPEYLIYGLDNAFKVYK